MFINDRKLVTIYVQSSLLDVLSSLSILSVTCRRQTVIWGKCRPLCELNGGGNADSFMTQILLGIEEPRAQSPERKTEHEKRR
jgi:hypothetical protein